MPIVYRKAILDDLHAIVSLLADDTLGRKREAVSMPLDRRYQEAFSRIDQDPNQYLVVACDDASIIGSCHLTLMPSLTFTGTMRMQIEGVRIAPQMRGQGIGEAMIQAAIAWGESHGAGIIQLSTHKERAQAHEFYEKLGFQPTHIGMKRYLRRTCFSD